MKSKLLAVVLCYFSRQFADGLPMSANSNSNANPHRFSACVSSMVPRSSILKRHRLLPRRIRHYEVARTPSAPRTYKEGTYSLRGAFFQPPDSIPKRTSCLERPVATSSGYLTNPFAPPSPSSSLPHPRTPNPHPRVFPRRCATPAPPVASITWTDKRRSPHPPQSGSWP